MTATPKPGHRHVSGFAVTICGVLPADPANRDDILRASKEMDDMVDLLRRKGLLRVSVETMFRQRAEVEKEPTKQAAE